MKHAKHLIPLLTLCLLLAACGPKPAASSEGDASTTPDISVSVPDKSQPDVSQPEPDVSAPETPAPLTDADKAAAEDAACDYYLGTVFEVHSLTEISPKEGGDHLPGVLFQGRGKAGPGPDHQPGAEKRRMVRSQ